MSRVVALLSFSLAALCLVAGASAAPGPRLVFGPADIGEQQTSSNWSGYAITGTGPTGEPTTFTNVTARWTQPAANCDQGTESYAAFWIGLGGFSQESRALEQIGTESDCTASGDAAYSAWYEIVPAPATPIKMKIESGDRMLGAVLVRGSQVILQITNLTRHARVTKRVNVPAPDLTSSEWVAEAPSECGGSGRCQTLPLTNFGTVAFDSIAATGDAHPGTLTDPAWTATPIVLAENGRGGFDPRFRQPPTAPTTGAVPGDPTPDGRGFSVTWQAEIQP